MKNTIYKLGFLLLIFTVILSCESPEGETNYKDATATYEYPAGITLGLDFIGSDSFQFTVNIAGAGEAYYVVVEGGSDAPTSNDVLGGTADGLIQSGNFDLDGSSTTIDIQNLCNGSTYDVYAVHFTSDSFLSEGIFTTSVTTSTLDISGTYTGSPFAFGEYAFEFTATLALIEGTTNEYTIDTAWGPDMVYWLTGDPDNQGAFLYSGTLTIDSEEAITIVGDSGWSAIGGSGDYDSSCINVFTYTLDQELFGNPFQVDVVLTQDQQ